MSVTEDRQPANIAPTRAANLVNYPIAVADGIGWPLGMAFFSTTTLLPDFLLKLHASYFLIGLLPGIINIGYFVPGIFVAARISRLPYVRTWLVTIGIIERIPLFLIALLTLLIGNQHPALLLVCFYSLFAIHSIALGFNQPAYWSLIGKLIPANVRGRIFGVAGLFGGILALGVDPVTHHFLASAKLGTLDGYASCFLLAAILILVSFLPFLFTREHAGIVSDSKDPHTGHYLQDAVRIWRNDRGFRTLMIGQVAISFWQAAPVFFMVAAQRARPLTAAEIALYTTLNVMAMAGGNIVWGLLADRKGNKLVLVLVSLLIVVGTGLTLMSSLVPWALVFTLTALGSGGNAIVSNNMVLEFAPSEGEMSFYLATFNIVTVVAKASGPIIAGLVAERYGFGPVFVAGLACAIITVMLSIALPEPRKRSLLAGS